MSRKHSLAIVLIHGWCSNRTLWAVQVEHLSMHYRVYTLDLSGHGKAVAKPSAYRIRDFAQEVVGLIQAEGLDDVVLVGHSMGGAVGLEAAGLCPEKVRAVVLADTFLFDYGFFDESSIAATLSGMRQDMSGSVRTLVFDVSATSAPQTLKELIVNTLLQTPKEIAIAAFDSLLRWRLTELLPRVRAPIYAINGDKISPEAGLRYRNDIREYRMEGAGHFLQLEEPAKFNAILDTILQEIESQPDQEARRA